MGEKKGFFCLLENMYSIIDVLIFSCWSCICFWKYSCVFYGCYGGGRLVVSGDCEYFIMFLFCFRLLLGYGFIID